MSGQRSSVSSGPDVSALVDFGIDTSGVRAPEREVLTMVVYEKQLYLF